MTLYYERQVPCMRNAIFAHYRQIRIFFFFLQNIYFLSLLACQLLTCKQTTALESNYYKTRYLTPKYVEFDPSVNFNILEEIKSNEGNFSTCISFDKTRKSYIQASLLVAWKSCFTYHKTLLYVQFLDRMQNMKLHLFLCLDFAKIRVRTIDQKRQNFSLFDRKTLCITQLQCKLISNYFIYLIHVYFKSHT